MLDIILILILAVFTVRGYARGAAKMLASILQLVIALLGAYILYPVLAHILIKTPLYDSIFVIVFEKVKGLDFGTGLQTQGANIINQITWMPKFVLENIVASNNAAVYQALNVSTINQYVAAGITQVIINCLAVFILWGIIHLLLFSILQTFVKIIEMLPLISQANKMVGLVVGFIQGFLILSIFGLIVPIVASKIPEFGALVEQSLITQWLYTHNIFMAIYAATMKSLQATK